MALEPYSPCPCGSGKKFKWCCQAIHQPIDEAFRQEANGQHEAALRAMDAVIAEHPANPEVFGRKAQLLFMNGRPDEAENALQTAFAINPNYPFGHLLQGMFRQSEGELAGAVLLFRKAAELYDPEARDQRFNLYSTIGELELKLNRPVAARAALQIALRYQPAGENLQATFDEVFGDKSRLPASASREHAFQSPPPAVTGERRMAWDRVLAEAATGRLTDAARAFEQVVAEDVENAAAWYNLAVVRAWLGDNAGALEALDHYVAQEPDETRAAAAWALAEVLRLGQGMEDQADIVEHSALFRIRDPQRVVACLQEWEKSRRLIVLQAPQQEGEVLLVVIFDRTTTIATDIESGPLPRLGAYLMIATDVVRLWNTNRDALDRVREEFQQWAGPALSEARLQRGPANFTDVMAEALVFPLGPADKPWDDQRFARQLQSFYEETWLHRPLRSLDSVPPIDAAGHPVLRKKLRGVVQFLEECAAPNPRLADFDQLRRKLGLLAPRPAPAAGTETVVDIESLGAAELAGLQPEPLTDEQLERAYQAAVKLDASELAGRFAKTLVARPPRPDRPDRYPWYAHLLQLALTEGNTAAALDYVNEGERIDCEHNEGRRRNDYELRRGQIHAKRGEAVEAQSVFERLVERAPAELRYCGSAAEALLSAGQGPGARQFAERGLTEARKKNDRDSEDYFKELVAAAQKQGG